MFLLVFFLSFCFPFVISVGGVEYDKQDFYSKYSLSEWEHATDKQKQSILEDYIRRESATLEAYSLGFDLDPSLVGRFLEIKKQLLVNFYYDKHIALPLVSQNDLKQALEGLKKEVRVKHLLVSHSESELPQKNHRNKKEAVVLINKLRGFLGDIPLDSLIVLYSDDPGAQRNLGDLGWLEWGRTPMAFQSSVWKMEPNSFSAPIETQYGYHLASVIDSRPSQFFYYDSSSYYYESVKRSLSLIRNLLPAAALSYEDAVFEKEVFINQENFNVLFSLLKEHRASLLVGERFVFIDFLKNVENKLLLFSFKNKHYGARYFLSGISNQNPSKVPDFQSVEELVSYFKLLILRHVVEVGALEQKLEEEVFFVKRFNIEKSRLMYDFYLRNLVNSVPTPDSSSIRQYYLENRENKYFNPEKVVVRQIKLNSKILADSLSLIVSNNNFKDFASTFSINRKSTAGLMPEFERGKYNSLGEVAFSLSIGEVSGVIENLDKTFSIILLEEKKEKEHLPLSRVYKRIESLLLKEGQESIKKTTFEKYLNNKKLRVGDEYKIYIN